METPEELRARLLPGKMVRKFQNLSACSATESLLDRKPKGTWHGHILQQTLLAPNIHNQVIKRLSACSLGVMGIRYAHRSLSYMHDLAYQHILFHPDAHTHTLSQTYWIQGQACLLAAASPHYLHIFSLQRFFSEVRLLHRPDQLCYA